MVYHVAGERRATLVIDGRELEVGEGDATPLGVVSLIERDAVTIGSGEGRTLALFE